MSPSATLLVTLLATLAPAISAQPEAFDRETVEAEVVAALDASMTAFNAMDLDAWEATFHRWGVKLRSSFAP